MQNFFVKSGLISFKIWFFALLANTIIGSFMLGGFKPDFFMYFIWGGMFGGISSLPILFIFWVLLYFLFSNRTDYEKIISRLLMIGILLALATFLCFTFWWGYNIGSIFSLCVLAIVSGIIGNLSQIRAIQNVCKKRDEAFIIETPSTN